MDTEGRVLSELTPHTQEGFLFECYRIKTEPKGALWGFDGKSLARLDASGNVLELLGRTFAADALGEMVSSTVDKQDNVYALDRRTGVIHVFDQTGQRLRLVRTPAQDADRFNTRIQVTPTGTLLMSFRDRLNTRHPRHLDYAPDGKQLAELRLGLDPIEKEIYALPREGSFLVLGWEKALIFDAEHKVEKRIRHRSDRHWLSNPSHASIGLDGSLAIGSSERVGWYSSVPYISLFNQKAEPLRTIQLSKDWHEHCFAYSGQYLAFLSDTALFLLDNEGRLIDRQVLPEGFDAKREHALFFARQGRELWLMANGIRLHRFALPSN